MGTITEPGPPILPPFPLKLELRRSSAGRLPALIIL